MIEHKRVLNSKKGNPTAGDNLKDIHLKCALCNKQKPLNEMQLLRRFKPPVLACKDCRRIW